ncbi:MAG: diguanylate cyclase [Solirubrobacteraceae bacterium]
MLLLIAAVTAGAVAVAGGGVAFWLCVPAVLLGVARSRSRRGAATSTAIIMGAAAAAALLHRQDQSARQLALAAVVPLASVAVLVAVRERLERQCETLRRSALSDPLTGIANRRSLLARIDYEISRHARARSSFTLVMIDLDGFKLLNDRFGHLAGDDLLRDVALALQRTIRAQDTAGRIGGDEFCVLAPETDGPGTRRLEARVARAVASVTAGLDTLQASLGTASFPADGGSPQALLDAADHRLLAAKRALGSARVQRRAA